MTPEYFRFLFDYNFWARDRLLGHVALLTREEYERPNGFTYGSIRGILVHGLSGEWIWRSRWQDRVNPTTPELLTAHLEYSGTDGQRWSHPLWQLMAHMVNHATNHRSEAAESLTMIGQSPGDLDMTVFIRQRLPALGSG
jgi:uncharacterized damage-inducible protein DinB